MHCLLSELNLPVLYIPCVLSSLQECFDGHGGLKCVGVSHSGKKSGIDFKLAELFDIDFEMVAPARFEDRLDILKVS